MRPAPLSLVPRKQPEKAEQAAIVQLLRTIGAAVYVLGTRRRKGDHPGKMQTPGIPDIYAFLPWPHKPCEWQHAVWIEVKAKQGRLSAEQKRFRVHCEASCQSHLVGGLDVVIAYLRDGGWIK